MLAVNQDWKNNPVAVMDCNKSTNKLNSNRPFPSSLVPLFQSESKCETFLMKMSSACSFIFMQIKVIFIRMVSHLDSLWNRGTRGLGNGLLHVLCAVENDYQLQMIIYCTVYHSRRLRRLQLSLHLYRHFLLLPHQSPIHFFICLRIHGFVWLFIDIFVFIFFLMFRFSEGWRPFIFPYSSSKNASWYLFIRILEVKRIFSVPRVVPWFPLLGLTPNGSFMGFT